MLYLVFEFIYIHGAAIAQAVKLYLDMYISMWHTCSYYSLAALEYLAVALVTSTHACAMATVV